MTEEIKKYAMDFKSKLIEELSTVKNVSITMDIWSDRTMRGFMGVTCHFYKSGTGMLSRLLSCERFNGM